jgi:hypothetical protein
MCLLLPLLLLLSPCLPGSEAFGAGGRRQQRPRKITTDIAQQRKFQPKPTKTTTTTTLFISTEMRNTERNFYAILQVNRKANDAEIKLAYRRLAKIYHPGMSNGVKRSEVKWAKVN